MWRFGLILFLTSMTISSTNTQNAVDCGDQNDIGIDPRKNEAEYEKCETSATQNTSEDITSDQQSAVACGHRNVHGIAPRILGDNEAEYGEFPWMVTVLKQELIFGLVKPVYRCGGSLIHPSVVVTAAHCISRKSNYTLRAGEWDTQSTHEVFPTQDRQVADLIIHEQYHRTGLHNDIALLFVEEPFKIGLHVNTICLPPQNYNFDLEECVASGWGSDKFDDENVQAILKRVELKIVPIHICLTELRKTNLRQDFDLHDSVICAGGEQGKDTCKGDGGSPLICPISDTKNRYYQAGIVSWGVGCGDSIPAAYVNVALFRNWIEEKLESKGIPKSYFVSTFNKTLGNF